MKKTKHWKKVPQISNFLNDYESAKNSHLINIQRIDRNKEIFEDRETKEVGRVSGRIRSSYKSKLLRKQLEWVYPNLEEPLLSSTRLFEVTRLGSDDTKNEAIHEDLLTYQWNSLLNPVQILNKSSRKFGIEGTAILKVGWELKKEESVKTVLSPILSRDPDKVNPILKRVHGTEMHKSMMDKLNSGESIPIGSESKEIKCCKIIKNQPRIEVKDNQSIIVDPKCKGVIEDMKFLIDIYETDYASLKANSGSYFNLEQIRKHIKSLSGSSSAEIEAETFILNEDTFEFTDLARKKVTMYEYWGYWDINDDGTLHPIVASWINGILIRLEDNPFPHKKIPYVFGAFTPIDNEIWGESNADLIRDDQNGATNIIRAMQDITAENAVGQEFIDRTLFQDDPVQMENYRKNRTVFTRKGADVKNGIFRKSVEPVPNVLFDVLGLYSSNASKMTGVGDFDNKDNRAVRSVSGDMISNDAVSNREMGILRRFVGMIKSASEMIIEMNREYILPSAVYMDAHNNKKTIDDISSLVGDFAVSIEVSTPQINNRKASRLMKLMDTAAGNMSAEVAGEHYAKIASLWGFKDLSDKVIENINRPPSEFEQKAQQIELERLELENRRIKLEILREAKLIESEDYKNKERDAKAYKISGYDANESKTRQGLNTAHTEKLIAQTELFNQEFDLIDSGVVQQNKELSDEFQHEANLEREKIRTDREIQLNELNKKNNKDDKEENDNNPYYDPKNKQEQIDYIKKGTLENDSYDPVGDVHRNILDKNSYNFLNKKL